MTRPPAKPGGRFPRLREFRQEILTGPRAGALGRSLQPSETLDVTHISGIGAGQRPKRVLVADDDADVCALLELVLAPLAHVTTVHDAEAALSLLATQPAYDAIVSDFMLPGINGVEFVERVRRDKHVASVPILMISGHGEINVGARARAAGVDAFLDKPFTQTQLRATIRKLLLPRVRFA